MWVTFEGVVLVRSAKALLFRGWYWEGALWLPVSQIEVVPDGEMAVVVKVKDWLARKRDIQELEHYDAEAMRARNE